MFHTVCFCVKDWLNTLNQSTKGICNGELHLTCDGDGDGESYIEDAVEMGNVSMGTGIGTG